mgnify:CR=1 FL=1
MKSVADDTKQNKVNYKAQRNQPVPCLLFFPQSESMD